MNWVVWSSLAVFIPLSISFMAISWVEHRSRSKALDVLRGYAERGAEPPASVTEALVAVGWGRKPGMGAAMVPGPASKPTRENHLAHVAANIVIVLGSVGIAWWRMPDEGEPGPLVIWAMIVAIFFGAALAARLVGVFTTPSGPLPRDDR